MIGKGDGKPARIKPAAEIRVTVGDGKRKKTKRDPIEAAAEKERLDIFQHVQRIKAGLRSGETGYLVACWRYNDAAKDEEYLGPLPIETFNEDRVKELYGGGEYRFRIKDSNGAFVKQDGERLRFRIAGPAKHPDEKHAPAAAVGSVELQLAELRGTLAGMKAAGGGSNDLAGLMTGMAAMMGVVVKAIQPAPAAAAADPLGVIDKAMEMAERFQGNGGGNGGDPLMMAAFGGIAETLKNISANSRARDLAPRLLNPAPAPVAAATETAAATVESTDPMLGVLTQLRPFVADLAKLAARDADPALYAEVTLDQMDSHPELVQYLAAVKSADARARLQATLAQAFPAITQHGEWFGAFFTELWAMLDQPPNVDTWPAGGDSDSGEPVH